MDNLVIEELKALRSVYDFYEDMGNLCAATDRVLETTAVHPIIGEDEATIENVKARINELSEPLVEIHEKMRKVLIDNGSEEFGDCIIDELCEAAGILPTRNFYLE